MIHIMRYGEEPNSAIFQRSTATADVSGAVAEIIGAVRREGDRALRRFEEQFDHVKLEALEVTPEELERTVPEDSAPDADVLLLYGEDVSPARVCREVRALTAAGKTVMAQGKEPVHGVFGEVRRLSGEEARHA